MLKAYWEERIKLVEAGLEHYLPPADAYPGVIHAAMRYSVFAGGKRLRPVLVMAAAEAVGGAAERVLPTACAMEMIHTYSLIHDDLPAMDNDDFRRGKPTNHKVYGEGMAVLAGDALLTHAFAVLLDQRRYNEPGVVLAVIGEIAGAAGTAGMIGGQAVDLLSEGRNIDPQTLEYIHRAKTGALIKASVRGGAMLAGASEEQLANLSAYAEYFGLAFQITDDILDLTGDMMKLGKTPGSDLKKQKATYPALYSLEGARQMAADTVAKAEQCLEGFGEKGSALRALARYVLERDY